MIKKSVFLGLGLLLAVNASALEVGLIAGSISRPTSFCYGLSAGFGIIVPTLKFEFEGYRFGGSAMNSLSVAVKFRPKFGKFAPYVLLGAGGNFEKLDFHFSEYSFYTMMGCGLHILFSSLFSLRFDGRLLLFSGSNNIRISGGVFFHL
jgi:hypothetical protein